MKFPYQEYETNVTAVFPSGILRRPEVPLLFVGPAGKLHALALVDTGADVTLLPLSYAPILGVELNLSAGSHATSITGQTLPVLPGEVRFELIADKLSIQWTAIVGFAEGPDVQSEQPVVGHAGFLENFVLTLDGGAHEFSLQPIVGFSGSVVAAP